MVPDLSNSNEEKNFISQVEQTEIHNDYLLEVLVGLSLILYINTNPPVTSIFLQICTHSEIIPALVYSCRIYTCIPCPIASTGFSLIKVLR